MISALGGKLALYGDKHANVELVMKLINLSLMFRFVSGVDQEFFFVFPATAEGYLLY